MNLKHIFIVFFCCLSCSLFAEKTVTAVPLEEEETAEKTVISPETTFSVCYTDSFWGINIYLTEPDPETDNILEIFFAPPGKSYYQFYGSVRDHSIAFYPHGKFDAETYPELRGWGRSTEKTDTGYIVRFMIPWSNFLYLPDQTEWKFSIFRQRGAKQETWSGKLHKPETWGKLVFPEPDAESKQRRTEKLAAEFGSKLMFLSGWLDDELYNRNSLNDWAAKTALPATKGNLSLETLRDVLLIRKFIAPAVNGKKVQLQTEPGKNDALYITHLNNYRGKPDSEWKIMLNGAEAASGKIKDLPLNVKIGNGTDLKKGDTVEVSGASGALVFYRHGVMPGKAYDIEKPGATEVAPKRDVDGVISSGYQERVTGHKSALFQALIAKKAPRVFFVGDSITDGFRGKAWQKLERFRPFNLGISGDWTQNVLWRLRDGLFDICKPELMVLMIGTNNHRYTVQEVADGIAEIVRYTRSASPDTKILILGIFPRGDYYPVDGRHEKINAIIKTYADNNMVFYKDLSHLWIDENRKIRRDLLPDKLHPGAAGNEVWADAMIPILEVLLNEK